MTLLLSVPRQLTSSSCGGRTTLTTAATATAMPRPSPTSMRHSTRAASISSSSTTAPRHSGWSGRQSEIVSGPTCGMCLMRGKRRRHRGGQSLSHREKMRHSPEISTDCGRRRWVTYRCRGMLPPVAALTARRRTPTPRSHTRTCSATPVRTITCGIRIRRTLLAASSSRRFTVRPVYALAAPPASVSRRAGADHSWRQTPPPGMHRARGRRSRWSNQ